MGRESFTNLWCLQGKSSIRIPDLQHSVSSRGGEGNHVVGGRVSSSVGLEVPELCGLPELTLYALSSGHSFGTSCNASC